MIRLGSDRRHKYGIETNSNEVDVLSSANLLAAEHVSSELTLHDCHSVTELHSKFVKRVSTMITSRARMLC